LSPSPCSFVVIRLSGFPSRHCALASFPEHPPWPYPPGPVARQAPRPLRDRLPSQAWTDLEALLPIRSVPCVPMVSPINSGTTLLTFRPSGLSALPPRVSPALTRFPPPQGFRLARPTSPLAGRIPSWHFSTFWPRTLSLITTDSEVIVSLQVQNNRHRLPVHHLWNPYLR